MPSSKFITEHGIIASDFACAKCGYNLRTLSSEGACPECATSITASVAQELRTGGMKPGRVALGAGMAAAAGMCYLVCALMDPPLRLGGTNAWYIAGCVLYVAFALLILVAVILISRGIPSVPGKWNWYRIICVGAAILHLLIIFPGELWLFVSFTFDIDIPQLGSWLLSTMYYEPLLIEGTRFVLTIGAWTFMREFARRIERRWIGWTATLYSLLCAGFLFIQMLRDVTYWAVMRIDQMNVVIGNIYSTIRDFNLWLDFGIASAIVVFWGIVAVAAWRRVPHF